MQKTLGGARLAALAATIVSVSLVPNAFAQGAGTLEEITVTATKRAVSLQDIGISVTAFGSEALERINPSDSSELFQSVPNVEIRSNSTSTNANIFMRGIGSTGISFNLQSGVGIYADEVVLNSPVVNVLQTYDLERVEVLRGPQNTLYGRNTTGGAVNFISRKPEVGGEANGFVEGTYGRFDQVDVTAAFGAPLGSRAAFRAAIQYQNRDGIYENLETGRDDGEREKFAGRLQFEFEPTDRIRVNLKGHLERVRNGNIRYKLVGGSDPADLSAPCASPNQLGACAGSNGFRDPGDRRQVFADLENSVVEVDAGGISATVNIDFEAFTLTSITAYEENSQILNEDTDGTPDPGFHFFLDNEQEQISQELRLTSNSDQDFRWIVGAYYFTEDLQGTTGPLFGTPMGTMLTQSFATFDNTTYSGYGEVDYDVTNEVTLKLGFRYSSDTIKGRTAALLAFENDLPGVDLDQSLFGGEPLPDFEELAAIATANGVAEFTGGAVGGGPRRLIRVGGPTDPGAQINKTTFNEWGGKVGVDWQASEDLLVYAQWSRGFKSGRFNAAPMSIMSLDAETGRSLGDTPIRPEKVDAFELGVKSEFFDNRLRLNAAVFYNIYEDQQVNQSIAGEFTVINVDSNIFGGEVEANIAPGYGVFVDLGASFLDTETKNPDNSPLIGEELPFAPDFTFNFAARKEWELENDSQLALGISGNYVGRRFLDLANVTEDASYIVVNAQAWYEFGSDRQYRISAWGKNIFNEVYFVSRFLDGSGLGADTVLLNEPPTFGLTLRARF